MHDSNVPIDFGAVSEGFNVGGIDRQSVSHVSCAKSITNCKHPKKKKKCQYTTYSPHQKYWNSKASYFVLVVQVVASFNTQDIKTRK